MLFRSKLPNDYHLYWFCFRGNGRCQQWLPQQDLRKVRGLSAGLPQSGNRFPIVAWYDFPNADQITTKRFEDLQNAGYTHIVSNLRGEANYRKAFDAMKNTDIKVILSGIEPEETFINKWKSEPRISQWYMRDEPVEGLFEESGIKKSEFEALDTTRLVFVNLLPSYADRMSLDGSYYDYLLRP